jgi:hypothetical protein
MRSRALKVVRTALLAATLGACGACNEPSADGAEAGTGGDAVFAGSGGSVAGSGAVGGAGGAAGLAGSGGTGAQPATGGSAGVAGSGGGGAGGSSGDSGAGSVGGSGVGSFTSRAIGSPPGYMGNGSSGCNMQRKTLGFEPNDAPSGAHPLFLYFVGTSFSASDLSARYDSEAAQKVTEAMARRGFVALSVEYDNGLSFAADKLSCVFASDKPDSVLNVACALPNVDCALGIATWGHSQGALFAHAASSFDARVRAVWTTGYSGGSYPLSDNRLRVVNGEADTMNASWMTLNDASGMTATDCPDDGRSACLRADGSGWIVVKAADCQLSSADHCWFDRTSCGAAAISLEPNWIAASSDKPFALEANADWVAETALRP